MELRLDLGGKNRRILPRNASMETFKNLGPNHKAKAQLLRSHETRLRLMIEGVKDYAIYMLDREGRILTWNEGAKRIKGYDASEVIGVHFSKFYTSEDMLWDKPGFELKEAARLGRFLDEGWRVRKDGTLFWASVVITALRDENKDLIGFGKVTRDLTERKNAEDALRQANGRLENRVLERTRTLDALTSRFEKVARATDLGIWYCDLPFDELVWNEKTKEHFWMQPDQKVRLDDFYAHIHPDDRERTRQAIEHSIQNRQPYDIEFRTIRPGEPEVWKWIRSTGWTDYDDRGVPKRFDGITLDLTEQKRKEAERKVSELGFLAEKQKFEAIFYGSASPMVFFADRT